MGLKVSNVKNHCFRELGFSLKGYNQKCRKSVIYFMFIYNLRSYISIIIISIIGIYFLKHRKHVLLEYWY